MSKAHRGTGVRKLPNHGRGTCPMCGRGQAKLLYDEEVDGATVKVCKICKATANKKRALAKKAGGAPV